MNDSLINQLRNELLEARRSGPAWGNRPDGPPYVEPTILAMLALAACDLEPDDPETRRALAAASDWLAGLQQSDGALGISPDLPRPRWTTPLAILAWAAARRHQERQKKAVDWLLAHQGDTSAPAGSPLGHDQRIPGWAWVEGTHSWLEPTAMSVLALRRQGFLDHPRARDGLRLIRDRCIRAGGWNYGNSTVFGSDLRPQPGPTGLALLALAGCDDPDAPLIERSCHYLAGVLETTRAPLSLSFGILALSAWGMRPPQADDWLASAARAAARRSDSIAQRAYLLLAAGSRALQLLGLDDAQPGRANVNHTNEQIADDAETRTGPHDRSASGTGMT